MSSGYIRRATSGSSASGTDFGMKGNDGMKKLIDYIKEAKDEPRRLYLAGPMRGYASYNYPLFYEVAEALREAGAFVVNPPEVSELMGTSCQIASSPDMLAARVKT